MKNPFRLQYMRDNFDNFIKAYNEKWKILFKEDGSRCHGNSWANEFWRGYDNVLPEQWDAESKKLPAYAIYRAGQECRKLEE